MLPGVTVSRLEMGDLRRKSAAFAGCANNAINNWQYTQVMSSMIGRFEKSTLIRRTRSLI